jgi:tRNA threonylcarbamoyladenosine biosynthesis protein TsaE
LTWLIADPAAMEHLGRQLAGHCPPGSRIYLRGDLGAGKTTLVRGFLRGCGYRGKVKSPTYTLIEPYVIGDLTINHIDLYRIGNAQELETLGWRDYLDGAATCLVEWPERGDGRLGEADILIEFQMVDAGRSLTLRAGTASGRAMLAALPAA